MNIETPATYRIRVQGKLDESRLELVGGLSVIPETGSDDQTVTIMVGHLPDQSALSGVLNTIFELRLPLLSVENLDEKRA